MISSTTNEEKTAILTDMRTAEIRTFSGGATRNNDPDRIDFVKLVSLPVLMEYGKYMRKHRKQADGSLRQYDNWKQGGFPPSETIESLYRHTLDLACLTHDVEPMRACDIPDTCCAIIFNATAYLHRYLEELEANNGNSRN